MDGVAGQPFLPFARHSLGEEEIAEVSAVLRSDWVTMGPRTVAFEEAFADFVGARHAVALSSCTAALHLALIANGVGPGDEVILPSLTFAATANVVVHAGATPVFADVDAVTLCLDPEDVRARVSPRTKAIILVHYGGRPGPVDELKRIARDADAVLIEDAAHAAGTSSRGRMVGSIGDATAFSFYATKTLCTGEGGMLTTGDIKVAERARLLRLHGMSHDAWKRYSPGGTWRYEILEPGFKYNMTDIQAALGLCQLRRLGEMQAAREGIAAAYLSALTDLPGLSLPDAHLGPRDTHAWHLFVVRVNGAKAGVTRDEFIERMTREGVGTSVHFIPLHQQPYYRRIQRGEERGLPVTEAVADEIVSLPIYPRMTSDDVGMVVAAVRGAIDKGKGCPKSTEGRTYTGVTQ